MTRIGIGPFAVELAAPSPALLRHLRAATGSAPPPARGRLLRVTLASRARGGFELRHPAGHKQLRLPWLCGALLQGVLLRGLAVRGERAVHLHAASLVAPAGGAVLLPAGSGTGKSTAALALAAAGWRCCGDDLAFWEPATGLVHGTDFAIALKQPAPAVLARTLRGWTRLATRFRRADGRFGSLQTYHAPPGALPWRAPLRAIGFLERGPGRPRVRDLTPGEAVARLWPLRVRALGTDAPDADGPVPTPAALARLLPGVRLAAVRTARVGDVRPTIERWLGTAGPPA